MAATATLHDGSLWRRTAAPAPPAENLAGEVRADVAVVGGGFSGLSTALHLAEAGTSVAVVEAGEIAEGASGRNGGQVIPGFKKSRSELAAHFGEEWADRLIRLGDGAAARVFALIERHGIDCDLERRGWVRAAHADRALATVTKGAEELIARGQDVAVLSRAEIERLLGTPVYVGGMHDRRAGAVQPMSYARGLARAAAEKGARVFVQSPAQAVRRDGQGWRVETGRGHVSAREVVLATGAYTEKLWPGLQKSFLGVQSAQLASVPLSDNLRAVINPSRVVVSDTRKLANYFRVDKAGRFIVGGRGPVGDTLKPATVGAILRAARERFPALADLSWEHAWCGRIDITLDEVPHLCRLDEGVWSVLGYNGRGIAMATTLGAVVANQLLGGRDESLAYPVTELASVPFHWLRAPAIAAGIAYYRVRDGLGFAS